MASDAPKLVHGSGEWAICPFCNYHHGDCWEWVTDTREETQCAGCGKAFLVEAVYDVQYFTYLPAGERDER